MSDSIPGFEQAAAALVAELRRRWSAGDEVRSEELLARRPEFHEQPEIAVDLIYEEFCLRQSAGQPDAEADLLARFPQWAAPLRVMLECHRQMLSFRRDTPAYPAAGDQVGEFKLVAELARGSHGCVFLARQTGLADRPVVLKITPLSQPAGEHPTEHHPTEHLSLARLQHSNIVPLYCVTNDPARRIRALCMPYFGRGTMASLMQAVDQVPLASLGGGHIVKVMDDGVDSPPPDGGARRMLSEMTYAQGIAWIAAGVADALQFAHERGLVHLDLKPSNILLATHGQPMLLDFHLAREPLNSGAVIPESFGGTLAYMPPEQRLAMESVRSGEVAPASVDGRADIFALGAILYESLGGELPRSTDASPLSLVNPQVSVGLSDIVAQCLADRPEDRYADAASLANDLRRHLADQPLAGVRNRSLGERWRKWRRRKPAALRAAAMLAVVAAMLAALCAGVWWHLHQRHEQAELALYDGQRQLQSEAGFHEASQSFERGLRLLENLPFEVALRQQLQDQLATSRRLQLRLQVHQLADEIRMLYGAEGLSTEKMQSLAERCEGFWGKRHTVIQSAGSTPDLQDIALFAAHLRSRLGERPKALSILDEVAAAFGSSAVLEHERHVAMGTTPPQALAAGMAWERYALGRAYLTAGEPELARRHLQAALADPPAGKWTHFYYGLASYRVGKYQEAIEAFSVCIGSEPGVAGYYYNRGLAYAARDRWEEALQDYGRALALDPTHAAAALNRGVIYLRQNRLKEAEGNLRHALKHGADPPTVHYDLALVHIAAGDPARAMEEAARALERQPGHAQARALADGLARKIPK